MWYIIPVNYGGMHMKNFIALFLAITLIVGATIFCYAKETYGDIDKNGVVNSSDALRILRYSVGSLKNINLRKKNLKRAKSFSIVLLMTKLIMQ